MESVRYKTSNGLKYNYMTQNYKKISNGLEKKYLATISIVTTNRHKNSQEIQKILTDYGKIVMARLGVNIQPKCISNCTGLIVLAVQGTKKEIQTLTKSLDKIYAVSAKNNIMTK